MRPSSKLTHADAKRCIALFSKLDMFKIETLDVSKKADFFIEDINELRFEARSLWQEKPAEIESFLAKNKELSAEDIQLVSSWKIHVKDQFIIMKYYQDYAVFYSREHEKYYGVKALIDSFKMLLKTKSPIVVTTSLFPFGDCIIWDGLVNISGVSFGRNMTQSFSEDCDEARKNGQIILQL
jgi:hypothetical protein